MSNDEDPFFRVMEGIEPADWIDYDHKRIKSDREKRIAALTPLCEAYLATLFQRDQSFTINCSGAIDNHFSMEQARVCAHNAICEFYDVRKNPRRYKDNDEDSVFDNEFASYEIARIIKTVTSRIPQIVSVDSFKRRHKRRKAAEEMAEHLDDCIKDVRYSLCNDCGGQLRLKRLEDTNYHDVECSECGKLAYTIEDEVVA